MEAQNENGNNGGRVKVSKNGGESEKHLKDHNSLLAKELLQSIKLRVFFVRKKPRARRRIDRKNGGKRKKSMENTSKQKQSVRGGILTERTTNKSKKYKTFVTENIRKGGGEGEGKRRVRKQKQHQIRTEHCSRVKDVVKVTM